MDHLHATLRTVPWVRDVVVFDEIASTNEEASRLAARGAPDGTVVVAERQTAGRGRLGRTWWSAPGSALTASWIVRPSFAPERWPLLSLATGIACAHAIRSLGVEVELKWPNDVLHGERKLGGILAEARPPDTVVVGLGVNLSASPPVDVAPDATDIVAAGGPAVAGGELLARILGGFAALLGEPDAIISAYRPLCSTLDRAVRIERSAAPDLLGIARDVDERGALLVETEDGLVAISSGDAVHLRSAP